MVVDLEDVIPRDLALRLGDYHIAGGEPADTLAGFAFDTMRVCRTALPPGEVCTMLGGHKVELPAVATVATRLS